MNEELSRLIKDFCESHKDYMIKISISNRSLVDGLIDNQQLAHDWQSSLLGLQDLMDETRKKLASLDLNNDKRSILYKCYFENEYLNKQYTYDAIKTRIDEALSFDINGLTEESKEAIKHEFDNIDSAVTDKSDFYTQKLPRTIQNMPIPQVDKEIFEKCLQEIQPQLSDITVKNYAPNFATSKTHKKTMGF